MIDKKLHIFIDGIVNYFGHTNCENEATVGSPYLIETIDQVKGDYTGCINVTGTYQGFCYFTAPAILIKHLIMSLGESDTSESMMLDTIGEVANTLSGNARDALGKNFIISVPEVLKGYPQSAQEHNNHRIYAIPIDWKSYKAVLAVCLYQ